MTAPKKIDTYEVNYRDPKTGTSGFFLIKAFSPKHAEVQARDGYFGLLAPPSEERRSELEVTVRCRC